MGQRGPKKRKGAPTGIRFEPELKAQLEESSKLAGKSLAEEVSARLKASFSAVEFEVPETKALAYAIGLALEIEKSKTGFYWFQDPWAFTRAKEAIEELLAYFQPGGDENVLPTDCKPLRRLRSLGMPESVVDVAADELKDHKRARLSGTTAVAMLEALAAGNPIVSRLSEFRPIAEVVKEMLERIDGAGGAVKDLVRPASQALRAIGDPGEPLVDEEDSDDD